MKKLWEFLFDPWEVTIISEGNDSFVNYDYTYWKNGNLVYHTYRRNFVKYKYVHKFFKKEKIIKKYID